MSPDVDYYSFRNVTWDEMVAMMETIFAQYFPRQLCLRVKSFVMESVRSKFPCVVAGSIGTTSWARCRPHEDSFRNVTWEELIIAQEQKGPRRVCNLGSNCQRTVILVSFFAKKVVDIVLNRA